MNALGLVTLVVALVPFSYAGSAATKPIFHEASRAGDGAPSAHGTVEASERLMKELREIYKSDGYKNGVFSVELENDDNLYEWNVKLFTLNQGDLHEDFQKFKKDGEKDHIMLRMSFSDTYPNEPPFVRVVYPILRGAYVWTNGVFCLRMLTKDGWDRAYTAETVIVSILNLLADGTTEAEKSKGMKDVSERYTVDQAQKGFDVLVKVHEASGWPGDPK